MIRPNISKPDVANEKPIKAFGKEPQAPPTLKKNRPGAKVVKKNARWKMNNTVSRHEYTALPALPCAERKPHTEWVALPCPVLYTFR